MPQARVIWPLQSLNFFMADLQAGIGPFMGVFLLAHHWSSGPIGTVMTLGGVAGMVMTAPFGAMVDVTKRKRAFVVIPGVCAVLAALFILVSQHFWAGCIGSGGERGGRGCHRPSRHRNDARHRAAGGLSTPERS
jgi:MFS family permease